MLWTEHLTCILVRRETADVHGVDQVLLHLTEESIGLRSENFDEEAGLSPISSEPDGPLENKIKTKMGTIHEKK